MVLTQVVFIYRDNYPVSNIVEITGRSNLDVISRGFQFRFHWSLQELHRMTGAAFEPRTECELKHKKYVYVQESVSDNYILGLIKPIHKTQTLEGRRGDRRKKLSQWSLLDQMEKLFHNNRNFCSMNSWNN